MVPGQQVEYIIVALPSHPRSGVVWWDDVLFLLDLNQVLEAKEDELWEHFYPIQPYQGKV